MTRTVQNFIDGKPADALSGRRMDLIDPSTGEVFGTAPVSGPEDVDLAYKAAARAFESWRETTPSDRQQALLKFAAAMEGRAEEI
ncbi:MAG: betaine-aldehyde dehydrogenase, partial [Pseudonocardiales bacterium]|nr:betaine-aldehyde dehydrogenase [Pseudonocardiales bacterium]